MKSHFSNSGNYCQIVIECLLYCQIEPESLYQIYHRKQHMLLHQQILNVEVYYHFSSAVLSLNFHLQISKHYMGDKQSKGYKIYIM